MSVYANIFNSTSLSGFLGNLELSIPADSKIKTFTILKILRNSL